MNDAQKENSVEQRRTLLKGALAASSVVTMGYSGSALASFECVEKVRMAGGAPANGNQFTMIEPSSPGGVAHQDWAWLKVVVRRYVDGADVPFIGFEVTIGGISTIFKIEDPYDPNTPPTEITPASLSIDQLGYPKDGWAIAYFNNHGDLVGVYPLNTMAVPDSTPAVQSCLASINPNLNTTGLSFGG